MIDKIVTNFINKLAFYTNKKKIEEIKKINKMNLFQYYLLTKNFKKNIKYNYVVETILLHDKKQNIHEITNSTVKSLYLHFGVNVRELFWRN